MPEGAVKPGDTLDPVTLEIMIQRFRSIPEEMAYALQRTGYTVFVNETADLGVALVSPEGKIFGFPTSIGITMFVNLDFSAVIAEAGTFAEGDILVWNDPYTSGGVGSHLPDISMLMPVFCDGRLVCFVFAYVHSTDVGGKVPGSLSPTSGEIFQEGLRIPPTRLYRAGEVNEDVRRLILTNCRTPKDNWGDMRAMVTALRVGADRVAQLVERYGHGTLEAARRRALDYSEERSRRVIAGIPDGTYSFADYLDDDVVSEIPVKLCVAITVSGDSLHIDFTGTDPQLRSAFNLYSLGRPHPWIIYKLMFLLLTLDRQIPLNAGVLRPVTVHIPEGSVLNCRFPAAVGLRTTTGVRVQDAICGALAQALPDMVPAAGAGYMAPIVFAEHDPATGGPKVTVIEPMVGGTGATSKTDGLHARDVVDIANLRNNPLEIVESQASVRILRYGLQPDSGGAGRRRGGCGQVIVFEVLAAECLITARGMERHRFAPWGLDGGGGGAKARLLVMPAGARDFAPTAKIDGLALKLGDRVRIETPGGGGHGDPLAREPERVLRDVIEGFVTAEGALRDYGIVVADGAVDAAATAECRRRMQASRLPRPAGRIHTLGQDRVDYEARWTPALWSDFIGRIYSLPPTFRGEARARIWRALERQYLEKGRFDAADLDREWRALPGLRAAGAAA